MFLNDVVNANLQYDYSLWIFKLGQIVNTGKKQHQRQKLEIITKEGIRNNRAGYINVKLLFLFCSLNN